MGLFKKIRRAARRVVTGVATGGISEIARATGAKPLANLAESVFAPTSISDLQTTASLLTGQGSAAIAGAGPSGGGGEDMGLGNILGGVSGLLGTVSNFGGPLGTVAQIGSGFLSGFLPAQGPMMQNAIMLQQPILTAQQQGTPMVVGPALSAAGALLRSILAKISRHLGMNLSLQRVMSIIRRLGRAAISPEAVAVTLGISINELGHVISQSMARKSRRMNPGNVRALRRAHRRIRSFHKLCGENDRLKAPRRRAPSKTIVVSGKRCD